MLTNRHNCVECCLKHLASAAVIAREILTGYNTPEYRLYLIGNLNEAQEQIAAVDSSIAKLIRAIRLKISFGGLEVECIAENVQLIEKAALLLEHRRKNHSFAGENGFCRCVRPDILIPLRSDGSKNCNAELKFALRSIERHLSGYRKIWIASLYPPFGFTGIGHIPVADGEAYKQMNIHRAITAAFRHPEVADNVIFWADDNVLLTLTDASGIPVAARNDGLLGFSGEPDARIWHRSLRQTGEALTAKGYPAVNYESHTPVLFNRQKYLALESEFDFFSGVGLCYISLYLNRYGVRNPQPARRLKATFEGREKAEEKTLAGKRFAGYNDAGLAAGGLKLLKSRFPERSKYEVAPAERSFYPLTPKLGVVIGTYGTPEYVELQLAALQRFNPSPVLVVDDASGDPLLPQVCEKYGAGFLSLPRRYGHRAGDLQVFSAGIEWARRNGFELLLKLSRRFIPLKEFREKLLLLAGESNAITFSSYTESFGYRFRSECAAMFVPAWEQALTPIRHAARPGRKIGVEAFLHRLSKELMNGWDSVRFQAYRDTHPGCDGYALWTDLLGTDRKKPPRDVLWHDVHEEADYVRAGRLLGVNEDYRVTLSGPTR